jgi:hypothetical protein
MLGPWGAIADIAPRPETIGGVWAMRQVRGRSHNRRRSAAKSAVAKMVHMAITPKGENGAGEVNS